MKFSFTPSTSLEPQTIAVVVKFGSSNNDRYLRANL